MWRKSSAMRNGCQDLGRNLATRSRRRAKFMIRDAVRHKRHLVQPAPVKPDESPRVSVINKPADHAMFSSLTMIMAGNLDSSKPALQPSSGIPEDGASNRRSESTRSEELNLSTRGQWELF